MATSRSLTVQAPTRQGYSPLFDMYNRWATMYGSALPRAFDTFRSGDFSPFEPILPNPIDIPEEPSGRPRPRRWQFPVGWNLPVGQPGTEGVKLANFQVLRDLADVGSIPRQAVEICKQDQLDLDWGIIPTPAAEKAMQGNPSKRKDFESRKAELWSWLMWEIDTGMYANFFQWLNAALEDLIVIDALAIHILPSVGKKAGPLNSSVAGLELIDGASVRPILNTWGGRPRPPEVAWQQFIWGVPRVDLMDILNLGPDATIEDLKELNPIMEQLTTTVDEWTGDQLIYVMQNQRTNNPYGFGPVERCLLPISIMQARQTWQWEYYRSGSLPQVFMDPGEMIATPEEARELQEAINMLGGDLGSRHQIIVTPPGAKTSDMKTVDLTDNFDTLMVSEIGMSFGLQLEDFGMTPKIAALNSSATARADTKGGQDKTTRRSTIPRARIIERLFTRLFQVQFGCTDMMFSSGITETGESEDDLATRWMSYLKGSLVSIDETRIALNMEPLGEDWSTVPLAFTATGVSPLPTEIESANMGLESQQNMLDNPMPALGQAVPPAGGKKPPASDKPTNASGTNAPNMGHDDKPQTAAHAGARAAESTNRATAKRGPAVVRDGVLASLRAKVTHQIADLAQKVRDQELPTASFTSQSNAILTAAIVEASRLGAQAASNEFSVPVVAHTDAAAVQRATKQHPYLVGMAMGALGGSTMALKSRAALYAESLTGAFEQGYGMTAMSAMRGQSPATRGLTDESGIPSGH